MTSSLPILGISMGDPAGVGPEIILKNLYLRDDSFIPLLIGKMEVFEYYSQRYDLNIDLYSITDVSEILDSQSVPVLEILPDDSVSVFPGKPFSMGATAAMESVRKGALLALDKKIDALVTAPIYKKGVIEAGYDVQGHTDFLAKITDTDKYVMMLVGGGLRVSLVTIHIPLQKVFGQLTEQRILDVLEITHKGLLQLGIKRPRIAVCGLNPHAGEEGHIGTEERDIIAPAVLKALQKGIKATGVFPSDTVFWDTLQGQADAVVAMYHDQGLIPVKTLAFDRGVNATLGLPIIRTSPDHGTAFNIAGQNKANPKSMREAILLALEFSRHKIDE